MYTLEFTYRFEAAHRLTKGSSECATPHGHSWETTLTFQEKELDYKGMVEEFATLKKNWKSFIQNTVDHSFFHYWKDPILPALRDHIPHFRGLPFPEDPTTEIIAGLFLIKAQSMASQPTPIAVHIQETATNRVAFHAEGLPTLKNKLKNKFSGWWESKEIDLREIKEIIC